MNPRDENRTLDPGFILLAYSHGYFPMADSKDGPLRWYSPDPRAIIPLDNFRVTRSLRRLVTRSAFDVRMNTAFEDVIRACAEREETWISEEITEVYTQLHSKGDAHSVECWSGGVLAGGLYGVAIGGAFFGESMFSRVPNASKVALVHLVNHLRSRSFIILDSQFINEHIARFGAVEIRKAEYLRMLQQAISARTSFR